MVIAAKLFVVVLASSAPPLLPPAGGEVGSAVAAPGTVKPAPGRSPVTATSADQDLAPTTATFDVIGFAKTRERGGAEDDMDHVVMGKLLFTQFAARVVDATVAEALRAFGAALGVPMLPFCVERPGDPGLDGSRRIDLAAEGESGAAVLDRIVLAAMGNGGTWQVRRGRVEVGPKWMLARESARSTEVFPVRDMLLEPPGRRGTVNSASIFGGAARAAVARRYPGAVIDATAGRSAPTLVAAELVLHIETHIEPDAWIVDETQRAWLERTGEAQNPLARAGQWARMDYRDGSLVVTAPEFVLRQLRGDGKALAPAPAGRGGSGTGDGRGEPAAPPAIVHAESGRIEFLGFVPSSPGLRRRDDVPTAATAAGLAALGRLQHSRMNVLLQGTPARSAVEALASATGATLLPLWATETTAGMDPATPMTLELVETSGLDTLLLMLDAMNASSPCTWQLAGSAVEFGPKEVLARARRAEVYKIADLLIEAPYSIGPMDREPGAPFGGVSDIRTPLEQRYGAELGFQRSREGSRKSPEFIAAELLCVLERHFEPLGWIPSDEALAQRRAHGGREFEPLHREGAWISAHYRAHELVVAAPDFIHRLIAGYPPSPSPAD